MRRSSGRLRRKENRQRRTTADSPRYRGLRLGGRGCGGLDWSQQQLSALPAGIASANGRLESEQVEIATKFQGRISKVPSERRQIVDAGQIVARMDTVRARGPAAAPPRRRSEKARTREEPMSRSPHRPARQRADLRKSKFQRTNTLNQKGWATSELLDQRRSQMKVAQAAYDTAVAARDAANATIAAGRPKSCAWSRKSPLRR